VFEYGDCEACGVMCGAVYQVEDLNGDGLWVCDDCVEDYDCVGDYEDAS
jgi:hypothetical protein